MFFFYFIKNKLLLKVAIGKFCSFEENLAQLAKVRLFGITEILINVTQNLLV
jgi:hypothetical protein